MGKNKKNQFKNHKFKGVNQIRNSQKYPLILSPKSQM